MLVYGHFHKLLSEVGVCWDNLLQQFDINHRLTSRHPYKLWNLQFSCADLTTVSLWINLKTESPAMNSNPAMFPLYELHSVRTGNSFTNMGLLQYCIIICHEEFIISLCIYGFMSSFPHSRTQDLFVKM